MTPEYFYKEIKSETEAKAFICYLYFDNKMFHFDSDPADIIDFTTDERAFTDEECEILRLRLDEVFEYMVDPFQLCVALVTEK
jgi:hypothetical protein